MGSVREELYDKLHFRNFMFIGQDNLICEGALTQESEEQIINQALFLVCKRIEGEKNPFQVTTRFNDPRYLDKPAHDAFENARQLFLGVLQEE